MLCRHGFLIATMNHSAPESIRATNAKIEDSASAAPWRGFIVRGADRRRRCTVHILARTSLYPFPSF